MKHRASSVLVLAAVAATLLASGAARAQSINAAAQPYPERFVNGQDVGQSTRPVNLNPHGINYADCMADMVFQYSVTLSGFPGVNSDNMQVWATNTGDCTADSTRGYGVSSEAATCWLVNVGLTQPNLQSSTTRQFNIPVRALVGPQTNTIPKAGTLVGDDGPSACLTQASFAATSITVWFLPLTSAGQADSNGTPYSAPVITADLVGPPAPSNVQIGGGDTLLSVTWNPNLDADTAGYDVFIDPPPGSTDAGFVAPTTMLYCPDTGAPAASTGTGGDASSDAALDAASLDAENEAEAAPQDATVAATPEAAAVEMPDACILVNSGGSGLAASNSTCASTVLSSGTLMVGTSVTTVSDSGTATTETEAGILVTDDSGTAVETGTGGIAAIPCLYTVGVSSSSCPPASPAYTNLSTPSVTGEIVSAYTISGLTDGVPYNVAVSAVDGSGNVGPPSVCQPGTPAPVNDFFKLYREAGGQAGGSFCALEAVGEPAGAPLAGMALGAVAFTLARRRRRNRR